MIRSQSQSLIRSIEVLEKLSRGKSLNECTNLMTRRNLNNKINLWESNGLILVTYAGQKSVITLTKKGKNILSKLFGIKAEILSI
jgi:predicted transcriptional regulator